MKRVLYILLFVTTLASAQDDNDLTRRNLSGEVIAVFTYSHEPTVSGGKLIAGKLTPELHQICHFDASGNQTEFQYVDQYYRTNIRMIEQIRDGRAVESRVVDERGEEVMHTANIYDDQGRLSLREEFYDDGRRKQLVHSYTGGQVATVQMIEDGSPTQRFEYGYTSGHISRITTYGKLDTLIRTIVYDLNDRGEWTRLTDTRADGSVSRRVDYGNYRYDDGGNWIERRETTDGEVSAIVKRKILYRAYFEKPLPERLLGEWSIDGMGDRLRLSAGDKCSVTNGSGEWKSGNYIFDETAGRLIILLPDIGIDKAYRFTLGNFTLRLVSEIIEEEADEQELTLRLR